MHHSRFLRLALALLIAGLPTVSPSSATANEDIAVLLARGGDHLAKGRLGEARKAFAKARKQSGKESIGAAVGLSQVALREHKWDVAERHAEEAAQLALSADDSAAQGGALWLVAMARYQNSVEARDNGMRKERVRALAESREILERAISDGLASGAHRLLLAEVLLDARETEEARRQLDAYYAAGPSPATVARADELRCFVGSYVEKSLLDDVQYVGDEVSKPVPLQTPPPRYSDWLRKQQWQGTVLISTVIGVDGDVACARVLRGGPYGASEIALQAVRSWRFEPALRDGAPVPVSMVLTVTFGLR